MTVAQQEGTFQGTGDLRLYYKRWLPATGRPQAAMVISHGKGEHTGRYQHVARYFAERGLAVYCMDHRGFGRSGGVRGHVDRFEEYLQDLRRFFGLVIDYHYALGKPVLLGNSLGGLIALHYAQRYADTVRALIISSPWLALARPIPTPVRAIIALLAVLAPRSHWSGNGGGGPDRVRRDPAMQRMVAGDPLWVVELTPRWYQEVTRAQRALMEGALQLPMPSLWLQAGQDYVVSAAAAQTLFDKVQSEDKTFRLIPDAYHEVLNEPEADRARILADTAGWLAARGILVGGG